MSIAPWNASAWSKVQERRRGNGLPHALLFAGPQGLGKRAFADALARSMMCIAPASDGAACGVCRACGFFVAGSHPDFLRINFELRDDGKPRTEITVDQMRALGERFGLTAQFGGAQIALIDPADAMNVSASNALLKTLEEPRPGSYLFLVADNPSRLSATIRSRCQRLDFRLPDRTSAHAWLRQNDIDERGATTALEASEGNPGRALIYANSGALKLRAEVAKDLNDLNAGSALPFEIAQRWSRDDVEMRLHFAAALVHAQARAQAERAVGAAGRGPLTLTVAMDLSRLVGWFAAANRARDLLRGPIRTDLAVLELLSSWTVTAHAKAS